MKRVPRRSFDEKRPSRAPADPLLSPERYLVHRFGEREWGEPDPVPLVTVALGDRTALLRLTDSEAQIPLTASQWSRAEEVARRVAAVDEGSGPVLFTSRTLVVEVPIAVAGPLTCFFLTLALAESDEAAT